MSRSQDWPWFKPVFILQFLRENKNIERWESSLGVVSDDCEMGCAEKYYPINMAEKRLSTFNAFWPFYLSQHQKPATRALHYIGTGTSTVILAYLISRKEYGKLWLFPVIGYGFAWIAHFFIEKNQPATFKYPIWSFIADYKMCYLYLTRSLEPEIADYKLLRGNGFVGKEDY